MVHLIVFVMWEILLLCQEMMHAGHYKNILSGLRADVINTVYLSSVLFTCTVFLICSFFFLPLTCNCYRRCSRLFRLKHLLSGTVKVSPKEPQKTLLEL